MAKSQQESVDQVDGKTPYVYESPTPYEEQRIHAVAIYCSDGRLGDQTDDFLHQGLGLPRYDRMACPGGPACIAGRVTGFWESIGLESQLRFLIAVHKLKNVVLIAHQGCAYYRERLALPADLAITEQLRDMVRAAEAIKRLGSQLDVFRFFAHRRGSKILFEQILSDEIG